jgi:hypothetical protein
MLQLDRLRLRLPARRRGLGMRHGLLTITFLIGLLIGAALVAFCIPPPVTVYHPVMVSPCEPTRSL